MDGGRQVDTNDRPARSEIGIPSPRRGEGSGEGSDLSRSSPRPSAQRGEGVISSFDGSTTPAFPSTVTSCPGRSLLVAFSVHTTAGMPNSRATWEACDPMLPVSVTTDTVFVLGANIELAAWLFRRRRHMLATP